MKRIWFGAGLLIALLLLGLLCGFLIERSQSAGAEKLERAANFAAEGDWAAAKDLLAEAQQVWNQKRSLITALCDHEPIEEAEKLFAKLEVFAQERSIISFRSACAELSSHLEALSKSHSFSFGNFF